MAKYNEKIKDRIVSLIEKDNYTVTEICESVNISRKTYYEWRNKFPDFNKAIEEVSDRFKESILAEARRALRLKLNGCKTTSTTFKYVPDENGELRLKEKTVKVQECLPDLRTIQSVLERCDDKHQKPSSVKERENRPIILTVGSEEDRLLYQSTAEGFVGHLQSDKSVPESDKDMRAG